MVETSFYFDSRNLGVVTLPGQSGCQTRKAIQIRNVDLSTEIGERIRVPPSILVSYVAIGGPYFGVPRTEPPAFSRLITIVSWEGWEFVGRAPWSPFVLEGVIDRLRRERRLEWAKGVRHRSSRVSVRVRAVLAARGWWRRFFASIRGRLRWRPSSGVDVHPISPLIRGPNEVIDDRD